MNLQLTKIKQITAQLLKLSFNIYLKNIYSAEQHTQTFKGMTEVQQNVIEQRQALFRERSEQILQKSIGNLCSRHYKGEVPKLISQLATFVNKKILSNAFQSIYRQSTTLKTKQLIYAAINNKNLKPQKQPTMTRKAKQDPKLSTIKKQKQEEFFLQTDDISTILLDKYQKQTIGKQSRIDLENLLQIGAQKIQNKFISGDNRHAIREMPYFLSNKRSRTDKSFQKEVSESSFCKNLHFQNWKVKYSSNQKHDETLEYSETVKIKSKLTKQTDKSTIHQIFIFREPPKKLVRPLSQDYTERIKFIEIPVKSKNVKIIQCNKTPQKEYRSSQSLSSKRCLNTCTSGSSKLISKQECKYCSQVQKSKQILLKWKEQNSL